MDEIRLLIIHPVALPGNLPASFIPIAAVLPSFGSFFCHRFNGRRLDQPFVIDFKGPSCPSDFQTLQFVVPSI
jgi:hypothetical protein